MLRRELLIDAGAALVLLGCQRGPAKSTTVREVERVVPAHHSRDGAGVSLRRSLGNAALGYLDPFLLLDEIHSSDPLDYEAGFPQHPHRGFETVSYVLRGGFDHRDSVGNHGLIHDGGAQWMTAGRGIVHQEMPVQTTGNELWGLQLWVNLPADQKWVKPRYQDMGPAAIPELQLGDAHVRLVTGRIGDVRGPIDGIATQPTMLDVTLEPGAEFHHTLPGADTAFIYTLTGELSIGERGSRLGDGELAVTTNGTSLRVASARGGRFLAIAATPIREPIARRGPFVMTTEAELDQAFEDYRSGRLTIDR